jgi:REP element-mobilizing transposase RayT
LFRSFVRTDVIVGMESTFGRPLAYLLTFTTYGSHLIGDQAGSVDKSHNQYGAPFVQPNRRREAKARSRMRERAYFLSPKARAMVRKAIVHACRRYGWRLRAIHVRNHHNHGVVTADASPDVVLTAWKSFATRALKESGEEPKRKRRWTEKGSKRRIWTEKQLANAIDYVVNRQGEKMEVWIEGDE